jgi:hypothetical protein
MVVFTLKWTHVGALPTDADHKQQLFLRADIETTLHPGLTLKLHQFLLLLTERTLFSNSI